LIFCFEHFAWIGDTIERKLPVSGIFRFKSIDMGLYDRDYTRADFRSQFYGGPHMRMLFPRLTPAVKWLLIINVAVFLPGFLVRPLGDFLETWFSVYPASVGRSLQLWRLISYQFLHDFDGFGHIFWNMLILYFMGSILEPVWGSRKFLVFYLICGAAGGIFYPVLALAGWLSKGPLVGASGAILGVIAACGILFPNLMVYLFGIIPVRLAILALIMGVISVMSVLRPDVIANAGGEAAHLAGAATGVVYVLSESWRAKLKLKLRSGAWEKQMAAQRDLRVEVDRILQKVHDSGIHSLTSKEKRILRKATDLEQRRSDL
jgi:membrane associated rhomboid family serine protease